jgi:hypothetical protein
MSGGSLRRDEAIPHPQRACDHDQQEFANGRQAKSPMQTLRAHLWTVNDQCTHKPHESGGRDASAAPRISSYHEPRPEQLHRVCRDQRTQRDERRNSDARGFPEREVFDRMRQAHHDEHDGDPGRADVVCGSLAQRWFPARNDATPPYHNASPAMMTVNATSPTDKSPNRQRSPLVIVSGRCLTATRMIQVAPATAINRPPHRLPLRASHAPRI